MDWSSSSAIARAAATLGDAVNQAPTTGDATAHRLAFARALHLTGTTVEGIKVLKSGLEPDDLTPGDAAKLLATLSEFLAWTGRINDAARAAETGLARSLQATEDHQAAAESALGRVALVTGDNDRAAERFEAATKKAVDPPTRAEALTGLAQAYFAGGRLQVAASLAVEATDLANQVGYRWLWGPAKVVGGRIHLAEGAVSSAYEAIHSAHVQSANLMDRPGVTDSLLALGDVALRRKRYQPARNLYSKALRHSAKLGWRRGAILAIQGIAITHLGGDEPATAARLLHQAREKATNLGDAHLIADLGAYLVDAYVALDRPERRIDVRKAYLDDLQQIGDDAAVASQWSAIGADCAHVRRFDDARQAWLEALAISEQRNDPFAQAIDLTHLAELDKRLGNEERWREQLSQALELAPAESELALSIRQSLG